MCVPHQVIYKKLVKQHFITNFGGTQYIFSKNWRILVRNTKYHKQLYLKKASARRYPMAMSISTYILDCSWCLKTLALCTSIY